MWYQQCKLAGTLGIKLVDFVKELKSLEIKNVDFVMEVNRFELKSRFRQENEIVGN